MSVQTSKQPIGGIVAAESSSELEGLKTQLRDLQWDYWGRDGKEGKKKEFDDVKAQHAEMFQVFKALRWGIQWLIGPAGALFLVSQLLNLVQSRP